MELCHWLYNQQKPLILLLSARSSELDIVNGLKTGADDYLTKPFGMQEFLARVEALIRRMRVNSAPLSIDYNDLKIDLVQRRVQVRGEFIELTPQEFSLLYVLAQAEGNPLSRADLLRRAWPDARQPNLIQTVRNVGYRLNPILIEHKVVSSLPITEPPINKSKPQVSKISVNQF